MSNLHHTTLPARAPFDFALSLRAMKTFAPCSSDQQVRPGSVRRAFLHPSAPARAVVVEVARPPDGVCGVELTVHAELSPGDAADVEQAVGRWLGLDDDRSAFLAAADGDPGLAPYLAAGRALHQVRFAGLAEGAAFFTMSQRSTQWYAGSRKRRITEEIGPRAELDGTTFAVFPHVSTLLALRRTDFAAYGGGWGRGDRLRGVLAGLAELDEERLRTAPYPEVKEALEKVAGIGPYTSHGLLLRVLGRPDDAPVDADLVDRVYGPGATTPEAVRERYGRSIGWWAYLVRTVGPWLSGGSDGLEPAQQRAHAPTGGALGQLAVGGIGPGRA